MTAVTDRNGVRPGDADRLDEETVPESPFQQEQRQQNLATVVGAGAVAALVAYLLWRLKLRRTPPTPTERLTDAAKTLSDASVGFGSRAADRLSDTYKDKAVPAASRVADAAVPAGERLVEATKHLAGASVAVGASALDRLGDAAGPVADTAGDLASKAVDVSQTVGGGIATVGSGIAAVPGGVADAAHGVHKFWRKWTLRILVALAAGLGYTAGAAAGRERYEQIVGAAKTVAARPEVQQAQHKLMDAVVPDHGANA